MRPRTAILLLRLPLAPGSRLWRRAAETVLRAADEGSTTALEATVDAMNAAWRTWLERDDPALWTLLKLWGRPATDRGPEAHALSLLALRGGDDSAPLEPPLLVRTATRFDHTLGERARDRLLGLNDPVATDLFCEAALEAPEPDAVTFCVAHHISPPDEVRRALFFVHTGQGDQYRALDPDGALLALGYRGASSEERAALRTAMAALGDIDALRVLAGHGSPHGEVASLSEQERAYMVRQLTERRDWERLWQLVALLPLAEAVAAVRGFDGWRPSYEEDHRVFRALLAADPGAVRDGLHGLSVVRGSWPVTHTRLGLRELDERIAYVKHLDFALDGSGLAFTGQGHHIRDEGYHTAGIVELGRRTLVWQHRDFSQPVEYVAHLGSDTLAVVETNTGLGLDNAEWRSWIHRADADGLRTLHVEDSDLFDIERLAGDGSFAVCGTNVTPEEAVAHKLLVGRADRPVADTGLVADLEDMSAAVVSPDRRLVAVLADEGAVVTDVTSKKANKLTHGHQWIACGALSSSALICATRDGYLLVWHDPLTTTQPPLAQRVWPKGKLPYDLVWSPSLDRFLAIGHAHLEVLDVPETRGGGFPGTVVSHRVPLASDSPGAGRQARLSPRGDVLAVTEHDGDGIDLYELTSRPAAGPLGAMTHRDLANATEVLESPELDEASRTAFTLLRTCLEHRFRLDIGITDAADASDTAAGAATDDIELGGER